jgi:hypothetical protein
MTLSYAGRLLARTSRLLWLAEALVLSSRFQQKLKARGWGKTSKFRRDRTALWCEDVLPILAHQEFSVLEFGVADGAAVRWWADKDTKIREWIGFDTFEGLPSSWTRGGVEVMAAGVFSPSSGVGSTPTVDAKFKTDWIRGLIEDRLPHVSAPELPLFVLIDVDLYEPTRTIVSWLSKNGKPGDLVYFDEAFDPWNEGAALDEFALSNQEFIALAHTGNSLLIKLV